MPHPFHSRSIVILFNIQQIQTIIVNKYKQEQHILIQQKSQSVYVVLKNKENLKEMFQWFVKLNEKYNEKKINNIISQQNQIDQSSQYEQINNYHKNIYIIPYTSKHPQPTFSKLSLIHPSSYSSLFTYINISPKLYPSIKPNRAFYHQPNQQYSLITYGQGYSQMKIKQQIKLAVQCTFNLHYDKKLKSNVFILQSQKHIKQEQKNYKKQAYNHVYSINKLIKNNNKEQIQQIYKQMDKEIEKIFIQQQQQYYKKTNNNKAESQNYYLKKLKKERPEIQYNQIVKNIKFLSLSQLKQQQQNTSQSRQRFFPQYFIPSNSLTSFISSFKQLPSITPKSTLRHQQSKQISSFIFKRLSDGLIFLGKSSHPKQSSGLYYDQILQNKCFVSMISGLLAQGNDIVESKKIYSQNQLKNIKEIIKFNLINTRYNQYINKYKYYSLKFEKSAHMMKYSLIKEYQTKKAYILIKPYLESLSSLRKYGKQIKQILINGKYQKKYHMDKQNINYNENGNEISIFGIGCLLFWSIVTNQSFGTKPLLSQISLIKQSIFYNNKTNKTSLKRQYLTNYNKLQQFLIPKKKYINTNNQNTQQYQSISYYPLRFQYYQPFQLNTYKKLEKEYEIRLTLDEQIRLEQVNVKYLIEIYQICQLFQKEYINQTNKQEEQNINKQYQQIKQNKQYNENKQNKLNKKIKQNNKQTYKTFANKLLLGYCSYYKWQYDKSFIYQLITYRIKKLKSTIYQIFKQIKKVKNCKQDQKQFDYLLQQYKYFPQIKSNYIKRKLKSTKSDELNLKLIRRIQQNNGNSVLKLLLLLSNDKYQHFNKPYLSYQSQANLKNNKMKSQYQKQKQQNKLNDNIDDLYDNSASETINYIQNKYFSLLSRRCRSFRIYGQCINVFKLLKFIKYLYNNNNHPINHSYKIIEYISLLKLINNHYNINKQNNINNINAQNINNINKNNNEQNISLILQPYHILSKKLSLLSFNQKHNSLIIIDHCELLNQKIYQEEKSIKNIIYISRMKKGQYDDLNQLDMIIQENIYDELIDMCKDLYQEKYKLQMDNVQQIEQDNQYEYNQTKSLYKQQKQHQEHESYQQIQQTLLLSIKIKSSFYNIPFLEAYQFLLQLHSHLSQNRCRYKQINQIYNKQSKSPHFYKNKFNLIYLLPLIKKNQKVSFPHPYYQFIYVHKFIKNLVKIIQLKSKYEKNQQKQKNQQYQEELGKVIKLFIREDIDYKMLPYLKQYCKRMGENNVNVGVMYLGYVNQHILEKINQIKTKIIQTQQKQQRQSIKTQKQQKIKQKQRYQFQKYQQYQLIQQKEQFQKQKQYVSEEKDQLSRQLKIFTQKHQILIKFLQIFQIRYKQLEKQYQQ